MKRDLEALRGIVETRRRMLFRAEAALYEAQGDRDAAEWKKAEAAGDMDAAHAAWVQMMARLHLRNGDEPEPRAVGRDAILAAMATLRAAAEGRS